MQSLTNFIAFAWLSLCSIADVTFNNDQSLSSNTISTMLKGYDKVIRPESHDSTNITVSIYFGYTKWQMNELHTVLYLRQLWSDPRLKRKTDHTSFSASDVLDYIWKPNTYFVSALKLELVNKGIIDISTSGDVFWSCSYNIRWSCPIDTKFAYESDGSVNCTIALESYSLTSKDIVYLWDNPAIVQNNFPDVLTNFKTTTTNNIYPLGKYSGLHAEVTVLTEANRNVIDFASQTMFRNV